MVSYVAVFLICWSLPVVHRYYSMQRTSREIRKREEREEKKRE
jgi:hypothetical protein